MNYLKIILAVSALLLISACSKPPEVVTVTKLEALNIPLVTRPATPDLYNPKIYVVTADNYDEFVQRFTDTNGELVFVAISVKDYENISLNLQEIRTFVLKQNEVIVYYEEAIKDNVQAIENQ